MISAGNEINLLALLRDIHGGYISRENLGGACYKEALDALRDEGYLTEENKITSDGRDILLVTSISNFKQKGFLDVLTRYYKQRIGRDD